MKNPVKFMLIVLIILVVALIALELFLKKKVSNPDGSTSTVSTFGSKGEVVALDEPQV